MCKESHVLVCPINETFARRVDTDETQNMVSDQRPCSVSHLCPHILKMSHLLDIQVCYHNRYCMKTEMPRKFSKGTAKLKLNNRKCN